MPNRFAPLLAAAALGLAACGSDSDDGQLSAEEYRERGNRICREVAVEAERASREADPLKGLEGTIEQAEQYQRRFEDLEPTDELRRLHERSVDQGRRALRLLRETREALEAERPGELQRLVPETEELVAEGNTTVRRLGLNDCVAAAP